MFLTNEITIFGYGSLINLNSIQKNIPSVEHIKPVTLDNYKRVFDTASTTRYTRGKEPACVLNMYKGIKSSINGVVFNVSHEYFDSLLNREKAYKLEEV